MKLERDRDEWMERGERERVEPIQRLERKEWDDVGNVVNRQSFRDKQNSPSRARVRKLKRQTKVGGKARIIALAGLSRLFIKESS